MLPALGVRCQVGKKVLSDELAIGRRDRLGDLSGFCPINSHGLPNFPPSGNAAVFFKPRSVLASGRVYDRLGMEAILPKYKCAPRGFKPTLAYNLQAEHAAAEDQISADWSSRYILNHPGSSGYHQSFADGIDQVGMIRSAADRCNGRIMLKADLPK